MNNNNNNSNRSNQPIDGGQIAILKKKEITALRNFICKMKKIFSDTERYASVAPDAIERLEARVVLLASAIDDTIDTVDVLATYGNYPRFRLELEEFKEHIDTESFYGTRGAARSRARPKNKKRGRSRSRKRSKSDSDTDSDTDVSEDSGDEVTSVRKKVQRNADKNVKSVKELDYTAYILKRLVINDCGTAEVTSAILSNAMEKPFNTNNLKSSYDLKNKNSHYLINILCLGWIVEARKAYAKAPVKLAKCEIVYRDLLVAINAAAIKVRPGSLVRVMMEVFNMADVSLDDIVPKFNERIKSLLANHLLTAAFPTSFNRNICINHWLGACSGCGLSHICPLGCEDVHFLWNCPRIALKNFVKGFIRKGIQNGFNNGNGSGNNAVRSPNGGGKGGYIPHRGGYGNKPRGSGRGRGRGR